MNKEEKQKLRFNFKNKKCPLCNSKGFKYDRTNFIVYCLECGLVVQATYNYTNGNKIILDFGLL